VKSIFFHLMPYRDLPADFETRYESIWVTPPKHRTVRPTAVASNYQWNRTELELADRLGFDGVGSMSTTRTATASWPRRI